DQHPGRSQDAGQFVQDAGSIYRIEIYKQVAAKDKIVGLAVSQELRAQEIAFEESDRVPDPWFKRVAVPGLLEKAVAEAEVIASERISAIHGRPRPCQRSWTDISALHIELLDLQAGVEQGHDYGIRFLT